MRTPELSIKGALLLLGSPDRPTLDRLDTLMGGVLFASGPLTAGVSLSLLEPSKEFFRLLRKMLDAGAERVYETKGVPRQQLIAAAHTAIVAEALFDALSQYASRRGNTPEPLRDSEKMRLLGIRSIDNTSLQDMVNSDVPIPSGVETILEDGVPDDGLTSWLDRTIIRTLRFAQGLSGYGELDESSSQTLVAEIRNIALIRYRSSYIELATSIPEFAFWSHLRGHSATAKGLRGLQSEIGQLQVQLRQTLNAGRTIHDSRKKLATIYKNVLSYPIAVKDVARTEYRVGFPTIEEGFIPPLYQLSRYAPGMLIASDDWWREQPVQEDMNAFLLGHLSSVQSWTTPTVLLGHPGAGKSLFTRVLAASLPAEGFLVVRVPLRHVSPHAPIYRQIEEALQKELHEEVAWAEFSEADMHVQRLVLLDGLDELIQVSSTSMAGYIERVREFQSQEAQLGRPVCVLVTSRALVADRMEIPTGSPILRLHDFNNDQIDLWLRTWSRVNDGSDDFRTPTVESILRQGEIGRQPLMLLLLALYESDRSNASLAESGLTLSRLYHSILTGFFLREVGKQERGDLDGNRDTPIETDLWFLAVAAFGMFNRGRQYLSEDELIRDLEWLGQIVEHPLETRDAKSLARSVLDRFFFVVHVNESTIGGASVDGARIYEFLHATVAEYLVAYQTCGLIDSVTRQHHDQRQNASPWGRSLNMDTSLIQALLSHRCLAVSGPIQNFVSEMAEAALGLKSLGVVTVASEIVHDALHRGLDQLAAPRHVEHDQLGRNLLERIAAYTANIVTVVALTDHTNVSRLVKHCGEAWGQMVGLWESSLPHDEFASLLELLSVPDHRFIVGLSAEWSTLQSRAQLFREAGIAIPVHAEALEVRGDYEAAASLRIGTTLLKAAGSTGIPTFLEEFVLLALWNHSVNDEASISLQAFSRDVLERVSATAHNPILLFLSTLAANLGVARGIYGTAGGSAEVRPLVDSGTFDHAAMEMLTVELANKWRAAPSQTIADEEQIAEILELLSSLASSPEREAALRAIGREFGDAV